ncbi:MAG TPA: D-TA family PLP-dependent enzyme [Gemmataceae bacterium]|jgi:D-serine deaminase-like pyridoxal phosphate-dependent protein|nr:D-TA family PLP-dependent enzyme [Gemmataceae bacterium]
MTAPYTLADPSAVPSPALLFYPALIRQNLRRAVEVAGGPDRLRPHVKTHKTREIVRLWLDLGVRKHKCATLAEAEMLAGCGAPDVLIAYPLVGPNVDRLAGLAERFSNTRFATLADDAEAVRALSAAVAARKQTIGVLLDVDVGQHRTGIALGLKAAELYELIAGSPGLVPGGLHVYDGHNRQENPAERAAAVDELLGPVLAFRAALEKFGRPVPRLVLGGTPTFPIHARRTEPGVECSPGTMVLHDHNYGSRYPDVSGFTPAAVVFTRVVSRPTRTRITLDLGTKAVAADSPAGQRCEVLDLPDAVAVAHNEEHLVIETPAAERFKPGHGLYAIPAHVCPTVALYPRALTVEDGRVTGNWAIAARDRN